MNAEVSKDQRSLMQQEEGTAEVEVKEAAVTEELCIERCNLNDKIQKVGEMRE